ncbi:MAG: hypothetical protein ACOX9R_01040 [Armatimonadota bacterium]
MSAFDEWNVWMRANRDTLLAERYESREGLFVAGVLSAVHPIDGRFAMARP